MNDKSLLEKGKHKAIAAVERFSSKANASANAIYKVKREHY
ncbi:hypothetical protein VDG1235_1629 [Verrucomicrobiia bacterium DG1235]|nr:hypothetical protein VDG1235_1629 [Verrucomicrobiae bacterium DG1235]